MRHSIWLVAVLLLLCAGGVMLAQGKGGIPEQRTKAGKLMNDGNYKEAYELYRGLALDPANQSGGEAANDLNGALQCLNNLGRTHEIDALREEVITLSKDNWRALRIIAESMDNYGNYGYMVAGKFERGGHRGGGKWANCYQRDRVRGLQLMQQAMDLLGTDAKATGDEKADLYREFANRLLNGAEGNVSWRLNSLTDLTALPDYDEGYYYGGSNRGAPVDTDGKPVFHQLPKSWREAATDGQRWRWLQLQAAEASPRVARTIQREFADFLRQQFDVHTMAQYGLGRGRGDDEDRGLTTGPFAARTLGEDETIARLTNGVQRFKLPDEFNFIRIYRTLAKDTDDEARLALEALAGVFQDRQQYPKAAECIKLRLEKFGKDENWQHQHDQIVGNWGAIEPARTLAAGQPAVVSFIYRNGKKVQFTAWKIKHRELIEDVKAYIKSNQREPDGNKMSIDNVGYRIVQQNEEKYRGEQVAQWNLDLQPKPEHFSRRLDVTTPLKDGGGYLLEAKMENGNTTRVVLWLADLALLEKKLDGKVFYYVGDAVSGAPVAKTNVTFWGFNRRWVEVVRNVGRNVTDIKQAAEMTDADGGILMAEKDLPSSFQWLIQADAPDGRLAWIGFTGMWFNHWTDEYDYQYNQHKGFIITDRPVYRPDQKVQIKAWAGVTKYDQDGPSAYAGKDLKLVINDPKGQEIFKRTLKADNYGGVSLELPLAADATLGAYYVQVQQSNNSQLSGLSFRVEEYKKPEFEVTIDAPTIPVMLGEKITATVKAKYYFGSPVAQGTVKYKVTRDAHDARWYPPAYWDWYYGPGYWWCYYDYSWYPNWNQWGMARPRWSWWWHAGGPPPEIVAEGEAALAEDGTYKIDIDTSLAKAIHGDQDHAYNVTVDVTDQSRRTISGTGQVLVARTPFKVYTWTDRAYYRTGDTIQASFRSATLDQRAVTGKGEVSLYQLKYDPQGKPIETAVRTWPLDMTDTGTAELPIKGAVGGQYRLAYKLTDTAGHTQEGAVVLTVRGQDADSKDFRFNDLELQTDKKEYRPGEGIELAINTNRTNGTVLLFERASNGVGQARPKLVRLQGKTTVETLAVTKRDMPNFFIEAVTISGGNVYTEVRQVVVPPEQRVLNVEVLPNQTEYLPGQEAKVTVKVTDPTGQPVVGQCVVSMYDKAVEYISGGSNIPAIRDHFWKWQRSHYPQTTSSLDRWGSSVVKDNEITMGALGVFGGQEVDQDQASDKPVSGLFGGGAGGGGRWGAKGLVEAEGKNAPRMMADAAMSTPARAGNGVAPSTPAAPVLTAEPAPQPTEPAMAATTVRTQFADTAFWSQALETNDKGIAEFTVKMPENLTGWKTRVWTMGLGTRVGEGTSEVVTRKNVIVRLQAPRFFTQTDEVILSANVHNYLKVAKTVQVTLELEGATLEAMPGVTLTRSVPVAAGGEQRVDWLVKAIRPGEAVVRMKAQTDVESDATEMKFPVIVHGILKTESFAGALRPDQNSGQITYTVPTARLTEQSRLEVRYSPSVALAMVDALSYMLDYPYGCTEQTLNRFVPAVITQKILLDMKLDLEDIQAKRTNLNAQEIGNDAKRAADWKRRGVGLDVNPVFSRTEMNKIVKDGIARLAMMQCADGGWGWFSGWGEHSWAHTTAVVVHGLQVARSNDVAIPAEMLNRGVAWLKQYQAKEVAELQRYVKTKGKEGKAHADELDAFILMILVDADVVNDAMNDFLYRDRVHINAYGKAVYGVALAKMKDKEKLAMVLQNLKQFVVEDAENQTAYLRLPEDNAWWYWYGNDVEAMSWYLKLLAKTDPKGATTAGLAKYLINNRKHGVYWNSTRDTSYALEALADFARASGETAPDMTVSIELDGKVVKTQKITKDNLFSFDNKFVLEGVAVESGKHALVIRREGSGPLYYNAYLTNFTLEDPISKAGLEIKVQRRYYKLVEVDKRIDVAGGRGEAVKQKVEKYERQLIPSPFDPLGGKAPTITSGDLILVELEIESKNDYEYIMFADPKPAGCEAVDVRSGYTGNEMGAYVEYRDRQVCLFVQGLARGKHSVSYQLRAEIPGQFSALPTQAAAMYAPELKANSDEMKLPIRDRKIGK
ncbi:MAG: MG2 domain-containing protein [Phycisphaerae bacterium]